MVGGNSTGDENVRIDYKLYEGDVEDLTELGILAPYF